MRSAPSIRALLTLAALGASGCVVYTDGPKNAPPSFNYAEAGCYWDPHYEDYLLYFDVDAVDANGAGDVVAVYADVYDDGNGILVDSYDLEPDGKPVWFSAWIFETTLLDPLYLHYSADIVAVDSVGASSAVTVPLYPCD